MTLHENQAEARILVVDDEPTIRELLSASLRFAGFEVEAAGDAHEALELEQSFNPDIVILDVMLPDMDGFTALGQMREINPDLPIVFLTAKDDLGDKLQGLEAGGDDYITKPFSLEEVVARLRAILRRTAGAEQPSSALTYADLQLNDDTYEVRRAGRPVDLSPTEFKLLRYLMVNAERVVSKIQILNHVWDYNWVGEASIVESYISYLRRKVDTAEALGITDPEEAKQIEPLIHTKRGIGYVLRSNK